MLFLSFVCNVFLFICGFCGIVFNPYCILTVLMCIELILLSINLNFIMVSLSLDDVTGQIISLFILTVTASESAIGLAILISYYRIKGTISLSKGMIIKG